MELYHIFGIAKSNFLICFAEICGDIVGIDTVLSFPTHVVADVLGLSAEERPTYQSGAYSTWLKGVIQGLGLKSTSIVGLSGNWGKHNILALLNAGKAPSLISPEMEKATEYTSLISQNFIPRRDSLPIFDKDELSRLEMPVLVVFGDKDFLLNATERIKTIQKSVPKYKTVLLPDTGHVVVDQESRITEFIAG